MIEVNLLTSSAFPRRLEYTVVSVARSTKISATHKPHTGHSKPPIQHPKFHTTNPTPPTLNPRPHAQDPTLEPDNPVPSKPVNPEPYRRR